MAYECEMSVASSVGKQPIVTNAVKAARQNVQQEAAHEFGSAERHGLDRRFPFSAIVFPAKRDASFIERNEALVGDGHPVGIAGQIG